MNMRQQRTLAGFRRAQKFLDDHPQLAGTINTSAARAQFDRLLDSIDRMANDQADSHRLGVDETRARADQVRIIREHYMRPIAVIAQASLRTVPSALEYPGRRVTLTDLAMRGSAMAAVAREHIAQLAEQGLPADTPMRLQAAVEALQESVQVGHSAHGTRCGATAGIAADIRRARQLLGVIDTLMETKLGHDASARLEWALCKQSREEDV